MNDENILIQKVQEKIQFPSEFNVTFQETIIYALLTDPKFSNSVREIMDPNYFRTIYLSVLARSIFDYQKKYKVLPPVNMLRDHVNKKYPKDKRLREEINHILIRIFDEQIYRNGSEYAKENVLNFCRVHKLDKALQKARKMALQKEPNFDTIRRVVQNGLSNTSTQTVTNYNESFRDRVRAVTINVPRIPTGLKEIDNDVLKIGDGVGGVPVKKLCMVMTFVSGGKTHFLVAMGAAAMRHGHTVLHLSLEDDENEVSLRYDSHLTGISSNDFLPDPIKQNMVEQKLRQIPGQLFIREYPAKTASLLTIRNHIEKLTEDGKKPSVVIVDYVAEVDPPDKRERRHELADVARGLRAIAMEYEVVLWTAAQAQRGATRKKIVKLDQIGEAFEMTHPCDFMVTIGQTMKDSENGQCKLFIAKNKIGKDMQVYVASFQKDLSRFRILDKIDASTLDIDGIGFNLDTM